MAAGPKTWTEDDLRALIREEIEAAVRRLLLGAPPGSDERNALSKTLDGVARAFAAQLEED